MLAAFEGPVAVLERRFPGAAEILGAQGIQLEPANFYPAMDISRARRVLGWEPRLTFESWLEARGWC